MRAFRKILIANRGEIAVRVIRACREMGIAPVAVHSEADQGALHVRMADESYLLGAGPSRESYLRSDRVIEAALRAGPMPSTPATASWPRTPTSRAIALRRGLVFIGPRSDTMALLGEKTSARRAAVAAGLPGGARGPWSRSRTTPQSRARPAPSASP